MKRYVLIKDRDLIAVIEGEKHLIRDLGSSIMHIYKDGGIIASIVYKEIIEEDGGYKVLC